MEKPSFDSYSRSLPANGLASATAPIDANDADLVVEGLYLVGHTKHELGRRVGSGEIILVFPNPTFELEEGEVAVPVITQLYAEKDGNRVYADDWFPEFLGGGNTTITGVERNESFDEVYFTITNLPPNARLWVWYAINGERTFLLFDSDGKKTIEVLANRDYEFTYFVYVAEGAVVKFESFSSTGIYSQAYASPADVISFSGVIAADLGTADDDALNVLLTSWLTDITDRIDIFCGTSWKGGVVPNPIKSVCLRACTNMVGYAVQNRKTPIVKVNDYSIKLIEGKVLTDELKEILKDYKVSPEEDGETDSGALGIGLGVITEEEEESGDYD
jgi:hypothetical protein